MKQELITLRLHIMLLLVLEEFVRVAQSLIYYIMFCRP